MLIAARSVRDLNFAAEDKPEDDSWGLYEIPDVLGRTCGFSANYKAPRLLRGHLMRRVCVRVCV